MSDNVLQRAAEIQLKTGWSASVDLQSGEPRKWYAVNEYGEGIDQSDVPGTKEFPLFTTPAEAIVRAYEWLKSLEASNER